MQNALNNISESLFGYCCCCCCYSAAAATFSCLSNKKRKIDWNSFQTQQFYLCYIFNTFIRIQPRRLSGRQIKQQSPVLKCNCQLTVFDITAKKSGFLAASQGSSQCMGLRRNCCYPDTRGKIPRSHTFKPWH